MAAVCSCCSDEAATAEGANFSTAPGMQRCGSTLDIFDLAEEHGVDQVSRNNTLKEGVGLVRGHARSGVRAQDRTSRV